MGTISQIHGSQSIPLELLKLVRNVNFQFPTQIILGWDGAISVLTKPSG